MLNFGKMRLLAAAMLVAAMFAACDKDKGGDNSGGKDPSGGKTPKVENAVLVGMDESRAVQLPYALYEQEEYEYVVYFTVSRVTDVAGAESLMASHPEDVLVLRVPELDGETPEWSLLYDGQEYDQTDEFSSSLVSVLLGADDSLEMSVALTFKDSSKNVWAAWSGTAAKAGYAVVDDAWAVGKDTPVPITKVVETVSVKEGVRKYVLSDAEQEVLSFTVAESYFAAPETLAEVGGDVKFVLPEGISDVVFLGESYPKAGADAYGVFKVTPTANRDNMGTLGRTVTFTYEDVKTGEIVRVAYDNRVSVTYNSENSYSRMLGHEETARTGEFSGNVYSYTNGGKNYILYSTVAGASTLEELKGGENYAYTVIMTLPPNVMGSYNTSTPGFALAAYDYNVDKVDTEKSNWWDVFDDGISSKSDISVVEKAYLKSKALRLKDSGASVYYTTDPSRTTDNVYFYFDTDLTPVYSALVRPSYRSTEQFSADYWGEVVTLAGEAGDPNVVLLPDSDDSEDANYIKLTDENGELILRVEVDQVFLNNDYSTYTNNYDYCSMGTAGVPAFGREIYFDSALNLQADGSYNHNKGEFQTPYLKFTDDQRTDDQVSSVRISGSPVPRFSAVTGEEIVLDHSVQYSENLVENRFRGFKGSDNPMYFHLQFARSISYWKESNTNDTQKDTYRFSNDSMGSPFAYISSSWGSSVDSRYGTTTSGTMKISHDTDSDVWTIDFKVVDNVITFNYDGSTRESGTKATLEIHWSGQFTK